MKLFQSQSTTSPSLFTTNRDLVMPVHLIRAIRLPTSATELRTWTTDLVYQPSYDTIYPSLHLLYPELTLSMSYINEDEWSVPTRARPECSVDQDAVESARAAAPTGENVSPVRNSGSEGSVRSENVAPFDYLSMIQQSYESQFTFQAKRTAVVLKHGNPRRVLRKRRVVKSMRIGEIDEDMAAAEDAECTSRSASTSTGLFGSESGGATTPARTTPEDSISRRRRKAVELPRFTLPRRRRIGKQREDVEVGMMDDADADALRQLEASFPTVSRGANGTMDVVPSLQPETQTSTQDIESPTHTPPGTPPPDWPLPAQPLPCHATTGKQKVSWLPGILKRTASKGERSHVRMSQDSAINFSTPRRSLSSGAREVFFTEHLQRAI